MTPSSHGLSAAAASRSRCRKCGQWLDRSAVTGHPDPTISDGDGSWHVECYPAAAGEPSTNGEGVKG